MGKFFALIAICLALVGCGSLGALRDDANAHVYSPPTGAIILRVEVLEVEFTDLYPGCGSASECIPFYFWYRYRARVKEVVSGTWSQPEVQFTHLQHAEYIDAVTRDCYVVLRPTGAELRSKVGVPFVADKILSRFWKRDRAAIQGLRGGA